MRSVAPIGTQPATRRPMFHARDRTGTAFVAVLRRYATTAGRITFGHCVEVSTGRKATERDSAQERILGREERDRYFPLPQSRQKFSDFSSTTVERRREDRRVAGNRFRESGLSTRKRNRIIQKSVAEAEERNVGPLMKGQAISLDFCRLRHHQRGKKGDCEYSLPFFILSSLRFAPG